MEKLIRSTVCIFVLLSLSACGSDFSKMFLWPVMDSKDPGVITAPPTLEKKEFSASSLVGKYFQGSAPTVFLWPVDKMVEDKHLPIIYLRGYLANYAKAVQFPDVESYPEYQKLVQPGKTTNTLSNPYMTNNAPKSSSKFSWFVMFLIIIGGAVVALSWESLSAGLFTQETIDTENIEMRLPDISEDPLSEEAQSEEALTDQSTINDQATADEQAVLDTLQDEQSSAETID